MPLSDGRDTRPMVCQKAWWYDGSIGELAGGWVVRFFMWYVAWLVRDVGLELTGVGWGGMGWDWRVSR